MTIGGNYVFTFRMTWAVTIGQSRCGLDAGHIPVSTTQKSTITKLKLMTQTGRN